MPAIGSHIEFTWSVGPGLAAVILAAAGAGVAIIVALYRRESRRRVVPARVGRVLMALRALVIATTALILLGPASILVEEQYALPPLVVLRDVSQSMSVVDRYERSDQREAIAGLVGASTPPGATIEVPRHELVDHLLGRNGAELLREIAAVTRPRLVDFATSSNHIALDNLIGATSSTPTAVVVPESRPDGRGTDLGSAIRAALDGETPTAIVLLTDGQQTTRDDPTAAAEEAGRRDVPLLTVGVGNPERPRNLAVTGVYARPHVWKGEPLEIEVWLTAHRLPPGPVTVKLTLIESRLGDEPSTPAENVVATQTPSLTESGGATRIAFTHTAREPGRYVYTVRAETIDGERDASDNQRESLPVEVLDRDQLRVLVVAGAPSWDYQLVERLLSRDKALATSFWLQSREGRRGSGTPRLEELPATPEALNWYDVVLLLDPDPESLGPDWGSLLRGFAEQHAGGILYMPGPRFATHWISSPDTAGIREILPVSWPDAESIEAVELLDSHSRGWPARVVSAEADHPLLRDNDGAAAFTPSWDQSSTVFWSFPVAAVRPTARVVLEHGDPATRLAGGNRPLLVVDRFGSAAVAYLGMQGTWRWRGSDDGRNWADRFWTRLVRFLAEGRAWEGHRFGHLQTDQDRYEVGDRITLTARRSDRGELMDSSSSLRGTVEFQGQTEPLVLLPVAGQGGTYEATYTARQAARHSFQVRWNTDAADESATSEATVLVELPRVEFAATWLDRERLTELARVSGGRYFEWTEIDQLVPAIPDRREIVEARHRPLPLWDRGGMLIFLVTVLGLEWGLRRHYKWE